jgi:hypothetical protein
MKKIFTTENIATFALMVVAVMVAHLLWPIVRKIVPGTKKASTTTTTPGATTP